jgi:N-acetylneuraminic acid mutarotase
MKRLLTLALCIPIPLFAHQNAVQTTKRWEWHQAASYGGSPTWFSSAFAVDGKAHVVTGYGNTNALWQYDPDRDTWTQKADFPGTLRGAAVGFSVGHRGYIGTGYSAGDLRHSDLWEYDPSTDRWRQRTSLPSWVRDHSFVFVLREKAYIAGGMTLNGGTPVRQNETWEYDPASDRWVRKADLPADGVWSAYFVAAGKGYVCLQSPPKQASSDALWEYDPEADRWTRKASFPGPSRYRSVGFSLNGNGYLAVGILAITRESASVANDVWEYDPRTDAWRRMPDFTGPARGAAVGFVLGTRVYIGTGTNARRETLSDFWWTDLALGEKRD